MRPATIDDYRWLYANGYMDTSRPWCDPPLLWLIDRAPATILDIGSGNGAFAEWMRQRFQFSKVMVTSLEPIKGAPSLPYIPDSFRRECVTCFDVLEHIPEEYIPHSLLNMRRLTERVFVCSIANMPEVRTVNGEDVDLHVTCRTPDWWRARILTAFPGWDVTLIPLHYQERFWFTAEQL